MQGAESAPGPQHRRVLVAIGALVSTVSWSRPFLKHRAPTQGLPRPSDRAATGDLTTTSVCMPISLQLPTGGRCFQPRHAQICHHHRCCRAIPRAAAVEASAPTAQAEPEGPLEPSQFKRDIAEEFTQRAPEYDQSDAYHHSLAESLVSLADIQPGQTVLDVATGTGLVAVVAAHAVGPTGRVFGIDMTHAMLCEVRHAVLGHLGHLGRRPTSARLAFERQCSSEILVNTLLLASNPLGWLQTSNPMQENACDSPLGCRLSSRTHAAHCQADTRRVPPRSVLPQAVAKGDSKQLPEHILDLGGC